MSDRDPNSHRVAKAAARPYEVPERAAGQENPARTWRVPRSLHRPRPGQRQSQKRAGQTHKAATQLPYAPSCRCWLPQVRTWSAILEAWLCVCSHLSRSMSISAFNGSSFGAGKCSFVSKYAPYFSSADGSTLTVIFAPASSVVSIDKASMPGRPPRTAFQGSLGASLSPSLCQSSSEPTAKVHLSIQAHRGNGCVLQNKKRSKD